MYTEDDVPDARDLYGLTKLLGEVRVPGALTIRTSIVGRELSSSHGLLEWFLANGHGRVAGYTRAVFSGLTTQGLAEILAEVIQRFPGLSGLYHVSADPISKYDLLRRLNEAFGTGIEIEPRDEPIIDRSLDSTRFRSETRLRPPTWDAMISDLVSDPTPYNSWRNVDDA